MGLLLENIEKSLHFRLFKRKCDLSTNLHQVRKMKSLHLSHQRKPLPVHRKQKEKIEAQHQVCLITQKKEEAQDHSSAPHLKKRPRSPYPMTQARFHRKVMELLVEIRDGLKDLKIAHQTEDTVYDQATTLEELEHLEESLKSTEERQKLIQRLSMVGGGTSTKNNVKWILDKLMTQNLQAQYNLCGRGPQRKLSFEKLRLYSVVIDSVQRSTPDSEMNIRRLIGEHLKFAPARQKGGRKVCKTVRARAVLHNMAQRENVPPPPPEANVIPDPDPHPPMCEQNAAAVRQRLEAMQRI